jgi:hypothetical protein
MCSFVLACVLLLSFAYAHPGKTDGKGGHTDRSTGEYHYHHGYPAHQHPNGTCIYEFDDKTGQNSGTPSGSIGTKAATTAKATTTTAKATTIKKTTYATTAINSSKTEDKTSVILIIILIVCLCPFVLGFFIAAYELLGSALLSLKKFASQAKEKISNFIYSTKSKRKKDSLSSQPLKVSDPKKKLRSRTILFVLLLLIFIAACANYMVEAYQLNKQVIGLEKDYSSLLSDYNQLVNDYNALQKTNDATNGKYNDIVNAYNSIYYEHNFYRTHAVIAVKNGHNYHKYDCHWIRGKDFYIYNKENAIALGLEPCYDCYYEDIKW